ncbi:hypothetical protein CFP59_00809 [Streptomyces malaysiensis subsp. malaysiensis]|nr:hypothetical protein CFP59_00809 [Streptomyces sp. M56]
MNASSNTAVVHRFIEDILDPLSQLTADDTGPES